MNQTFLPRATGGLLLLCATLSTAADFDNLSIGRVVSDRTLSLGQYHVQLPEGSWTVVSKMKFRSGSQMGSSATPERLTVALAETNSERLSAILIFTTPASTFHATNRWIDDPCKEFPTALVKDTMNQTMTMPECFVLTSYSPQNFTSASSGPIFDIAAWSANQGLVLPANSLRIYYTKYHGGDFFRANAILPGTKASVVRAEGWGREMATSLANMVTRRSPIGVIPALPQLDIQPGVTSRAPLAKQEPGIGPSTSTARRTAEARLLELKSFLDKGLISIEDFNKTRGRILNEL